MLAPNTELASATTTLFRFQIAILAAYVGYSIPRKSSLCGTIVEDVRANNNQ